MPDEGCSLRDRLSEMVHAQAVDLDFVETCGEPKGVRPPTPRALR